MRRLALLSAVLMIVIIQNSGATVMIKESVGSLSRHSTVIVVGTITNLKTVVNNGDVWTIATVLPESFLNGHSTGPLHFTTPGGQQMIGGRLLITEVDGAPRLKTLQKVVLFLTGTGRAPEYFHLVGLNQGYRPVRIQNGREVVLSSQEEAPEVSIPLSDFVRQVKESLRKE